MGAYTQLSALHGCSFRWKSSNPEEVTVNGQNDTNSPRALTEESRKVLGFIAQEVARVQPSAVRQMDSGFLAVNYTDIVPLLVEGLKAHLEQLTALQRCADELAQLQAVSAKIRADLEHTSKEADVHRDLESASKVSSKRRRKPPPRRPPFALLDRPWKIASVLLVLALGIGLVLGLTMGLPRAIQNNPPATSDNLDQSPRPPTDVFSPISRPAPNSLPVSAPSIVFRIINLLVDGGFEDPTTPTARWNANPHYFTFTHYNESVYPNGTQMAASAPFAAMQSFLLANVTNATATASQIVPILPAGSAQRLNVTLWVYLTRSFLPLEASVELNLELFGAGATKIMNPDCRGNAKADGAVVGRWQRLQFYAVCGYLSTSDYVKVSFSVTSKNTTVPLVVGFDSADASQAQENIAGALDVDFGILGVAEVNDDTLPGSRIPGAKLMVLTRVLFDEKLVSALSSTAGVVLARFSSLGRADQAYGLDGTVKIPQLQQGRPYTGNWFSTDSSDRALVAGSATVGNGMKVAALTRVNKDGSVDRSFGGTGFITFPLPSVGSETYGCSVLSASRGRTLLLVGGFEAQYDGSNPRFALVRLNESGFIDPLFGISGFFSSGNSTAGLPLDMALDSYGNIFVLTVATYSFYVHKVAPYGGLDLNWGIRGAAGPFTVGSPNAKLEPRWILVHPDAGSSSNPPPVYIGGGFQDPNGNTTQPFLMRLSATGVLDDTFAPGSGFITVSNVSFGIFTSAHLDVNGTLLLGMNSNVSKYSIIYRLIDGQLDDYILNSSLASRGDLQQVLKMSPFVMVSIADPVRGLVLARLNASSKVDENFGSSLLGFYQPKQSVSLATTYDGRLLVGSTVTLQGGGVVSSIAALNQTTGGVDLSVGGVSVGVETGTVRSVFNESSRLGQLLSHPDGSFYAISSYYRSATPLDQFIFVEKFWKDGTRNVSYGISSVALASPRPVLCLTSPLRGALFPDDSLLVTGVDQLNHSILATVLPADGFSPLPYNRTAVALTSPHPIFNQVKAVTDVCIDYSGAGVVIGSIMTETGETRPCMWKLDQQGVVQSFGTNGSVVFPFQEASEMFTVLSVGAGGNTEPYLHLGGYAIMNSTKVPIVMRVSPVTGDLDHQWYTQGRIILPLPPNSFGDIRKLFWDGVRRKIVAVGQFAQRTSSSRVLLFRFDPNMATLECFGPTNDLIARDLAEMGVVDALMSDPDSYAVAVATGQTTKVLKYSATGLSQCGFPSCGNGLLETYEGCDDGNTVDGDGCSSRCTVEVTWTCPNVASPCTLN